MEEEFRDIIGYEGLYQVSNLGRVKTFNWLGHGITKILKQSINSRGYVIYGLTNNGIRKSISGHRLTAMHFLENDDIKNKIYINHINGIKTDNRIENLEWCSPSYNAQHSSYILQKGMINKYGDLHHLSKKVYKFNLDGTYIGEYGSIREAGRLNNICNSIIGRACNLNRQAKGFIWSFNNQSLLNLE